MRVGIVGGGIGGLTAALHLLGAGHDARVFERSPVLSEVGAGLTLWPNATRVLDELRLGDATRAAGRPTRRAVVGTADGRVLARSHDSDPHAALPIGVHRTALQQLLHDALPHDRVALGWQFTTYEQDAHGVTLQFVDRPAQRYDILIGADGIDSSVRAQLIGATPARYSGYTAYRGLLSDWPDRPPVAGEFWGRGRRFGIVPLGAGQLYWFATVNQAPGETLPPTARKPYLRTRFARWRFGIPELLDRTDDDVVLQHDVVDRPPVRGWSDGRVVLLGDAAHPTTPNMGQGAAMAIEDAAILRRSLDDEPHHAMAFRTFERTRAQRTRRITTTSLRIGALGQTEHAVAAWLRDRAVALTPDSLLDRLTARFTAYDATSAPLARR